MAPPVPEAAPAPAAQAAFPAETGSGNIPAVSFRYLARVVPALVGLAKPRLTGLVVFTTLGGLYLAPVHPTPTTALLTLLGTVLIVSGAHSLNQYLERDTDALMRRTRNRPLPSGRLQPMTAVWFGLALALVATPVLAIGVNLLTAVLGLFAFFLYVFVYTPMKRRSPWALIVGAVPGAIPPLMGWTAVTSRLDLPGLSLFAILFLWQIPHFLAIALYSSEDYARGGIKVVPLVRGERAARRQAFFYTLLLLPTSLLLYFEGVAGPVYLVVAALTGAGFLALSAYGLREDAGRPWARRLFLGSLAYLTALFLVLAIEPSLRGILPG